MKKILWLDDQFGVNPDFDKEVEELYEEFALEYNISDENVKNEYVITTVSNYPEFKYMVEESIFDVVILDIDGMGKADREERSKTGFVLGRNDAMDKKISIVIYSGQVEESQKDIEAFKELAGSKNVQCEVVEKIRGVEGLCEALKDIFENDIWTKFPHIRKLIESDELSKWEKTIKKILQSYVKREYSSNVAKEFRSVMVEIIKKMKCDFEDSFRKHAPKFYNEGKDNDLVKCIIEARYNNEKPDKNDKELRDKHLVIPSAVMPREVKFALKYIWELCNIYHHVSSDDDCTNDFKNIMLEDTRKDNLEIATRISYESFLLFLEWYYYYNEKKLCKYMKI